jgi:hypothetical protein
MASAESKQDCWNFDVIKLVVAGHFEGKFRLPPRALR